MTSFISAYKKLALLLLAAALAVVHGLNASVIAYDSFNYSTGVLTGQNGGTGFSGAYTTSTSDATVTSPGLTYTDSSSNVMSTAGNAASINGTVSAVSEFRTLSSSPETIGSTLYFSFIENYTGSTTASFAGVSLFSGTTSEKLFIGKLNGNRPNWGFSITGGSSNVQSTISSATQSLIVAKVSFVSSTDTQVSIFINPTISGTEPGAATISGSFAGTFSWDTVRISSSSTAVFDEIRFGTTFADVVGIPEPSSYFMCLIGMGMLAWMRRGHRRLAAGRC